jgi:hypothetical protein
LILVMSARVSVGVYPLPLDTNPDQLMGLPTISWNKRLSV